MADQDPSEDDAAQVFEALRQSVEATRREIGGELSIIRKGLEAAFERLDTLQSSPDYGQDLGRLEQRLAFVGKHVEVISQLPALRQGAEHQAAVAERAGRVAAQPAIEAMERESGNLGRMARAVDEQLGQARTRREQNKWLASAAATGVVVGMIMTLGLPRILPTGVGAYAASTILADQPWQAGAKLMQYASPEGASQMFSADRLVRENAEAIAQCRKTASDTKKEQRCSILVR